MTRSSGACVISDVGRVFAPLRSAAGEMIVECRRAAVQPVGDDTRGVAELGLQHARPAILIGMA